MGFVMSQELELEVSKLRKIFECPSSYDERAIACLKLTYIYISQNDYKQAIHWATQSTIVREYWSEGYFALGKIFYFLGQNGDESSWQKSVNYFKAGLHMPPTSFSNPEEREYDVHRYYNVSLSRIGDIKGALESANEGLKYKPDDGGLLFNKNIYESTLAAKSPIYSIEKLLAKGEIRLNIGCGPTMLPDTWINYDREDFNYYIDWIKAKKDEDLTKANYALSVYRCVDFIKNGKDFIFYVHDLRKGFSQHKDNSITSIYIGQVIEHLNPIHEVPALLNECFRMLKPGGVIRLATPDLDILINAYVNNQMDKFRMEQPNFYGTADPASQLAYIMFGSCGDKCTWDYYEGHMCLYTQKSMTSALEKDGFKDVEFYYEIGKSKDAIMARDIADAGMTHSFIVEAVK
jgi:predicted SAM-dependent methyltransferase